MMRRMFPLFAAALLALQLAGCGSAGDSGASSANPEATPTPPHDVAQVSGSAAASSPGEPVLQRQNADGSETQITEAAEEVVGALRDRDLERLAEWIDPKEGLRFSPYPHLNSSDRIFHANELPSFNDTSKLEWGTYDGSGEPIRLTFKEYFEQFVYDQDFASAPHVSTDERIGSGDVPFNGTDFYPNASLVEYHFPREEDADLDWKSLILIFVPSGDEWRLCAIVHAQWTI